MIRTFIYGSCVSRDTFEFLPQERFHLTGYVARQSLLSVYSHLTKTELPPLAFSSPFQARMVEGDWTSSLAPHLYRQGDQIDCFLWDLCDERLGAWQLPSGHWVTHSVDAIDSGLVKHLETTGARHVPFASPEHLQQFTDRLPHFAQLLERHGLKDRTLLLAPPWAEILDDGRQTPPSFDTTATAANTLYAPYLAAISSTLNPVLIGQGVEALGDRSHKWGPAPFHYTRETYLALADELVHHTPRRRDDA